MDSLTEHIDQASTPKKRRLHSLNRKEEISVQIKNENRGQSHSHCGHLQLLKREVSITAILVSVSPSQRWCHSMCLSDPNTAILIGGETSEQNYCHDSLWKLELGQQSLLVILVF